MITASIIIGFLLSGYSLAGSIWGSVQTSRLQKEAQKVADALNRNSELRNKLLAAYQDRDYKLGSALIMNSPVGSAYKHLKQEIAQNKSEYEEKSKEIENSDKALRDAQSNIKSPTSDLVGAIYNTATNNSKDIEKAVSSSNDLVKGGIKHVS